MDLYDPKVRVVGYTQPSDEFESEFTPSDIVAYCARVSNPSNQLNLKSGPELLKYLKDNSHWSPFEMASVTLEITTTRDISRQILRHRSFSFQEFSQRYANPVESVGFCVREARLQDQKNRQNSIETDDQEMCNAWIAKQEQLIHESKLAYNWAIENGIAKEQARVVLPEGNMYTTLYMAGTVRSWIHYCDLRQGNGTQKEHQQVATLCFDHIVSLYPELIVKLMISN